jgi:hypothetical protein
VPISMIVIVIAGRKSKSITARSDPEMGPSSSNLAGL